MSHYLVDHALQNVWCAPRQDDQVILKMTRLTQKLGAFNNVKVIWDDIPLPEHGPRFHVYQIGQNLPSVLGLPQIQGRWCRLSEVCGSENLILDLYISTGVQLPRTESWFRVTAGKNLIVAVRICPTVADLDNNDLFIRFYSNAYFETTDRHPTLDFIRVGGGVVQSREHLAQILTEFRAHLALPRGHACAYINGVYASDFQVDQALPGDVVEWVYDSTIYETHEFELERVPSFNSTLDKKRKYLCHPPKQAAQQIDYRDDCDYFLFWKNDRQQRRGYWFHRNQEDAVRMVTHNDYAVPVPYVQAYSQQWPLLAKPRLRIHIRRGGIQRPLVFEHQRIHELYKLSDQQIIEAMCGINATLPEWQAANLEQSYYTRLMRSEYADVDLALVKHTYGYNAMAQLAGGTPQQPIADSAHGHVILPPGLQEAATVYEYNQDGQLVTVVQHQKGSEYLVYSPDVGLVEAIFGHGGRQLDAVLGTSSVRVDPRYEYHVYRTPSGYGPGQRRWTDVTGTDAYAIVDGWLQFTDKEHVTYLVLSNKQFLTYAFDLSYRDHQLKFSLTNQTQDGSQEVLEIPPGRLEIWLNGWALTEGLDYFVEFPQVVICNKRFLRQEEPYMQRITVRCTGFCDSQLRRQPLPEFGYVEHGMLSANNRFDLRDDRVLRMVVDGRTYHRNQLKFAEEHRGVLAPGVREGAPYSVGDMLVPISTVDAYETYVLQKEAQAVDQRVGDYMSRFYPQKPIAGIVAIEEYYHLYSPFLCKVMYDVLNGVIEVTSAYRTDKQILEEMERYRYLLPYDPTLQLVDRRYVNIHPHDRTTAVGVNQFQYAYLRRVCTMFLHDRVDMSQFLFITGG